MGTVVQATDLGLDHAVAVKLLLPHLCSDAAAVSRFEREARATAALEHPNLVPVFAVGRHRDRPFMVMKLLHGRPLSRLMPKRGPLEREWILSVLRQLCSALDYVHARGLIHRDVKPANVFVAPDGHTTLLDFGVLKDDRLDTLTRPGQLIGSISHVSPEQLLGTGPVDHRADIYALGAVLYELLTGAPPFDAGQPSVIAHMHLSATPTNPRKRSPSVPPAVAAVCLRALEKDPKRRPASAGALYADLERAWTLRPTAKLTRRRVALAGAGVAAALVVAAGGLMGRAQQASPRSSPPAPIRPSQDLVTPTIRPAAERSPDPATPASNLEVLAPGAPAPGDPPRADGARSVMAPRAPRPRAVAPPAPASSGVVARPVPPAPTGTLSVVTLVDGKPSWAELSIDGVARGTTPAALDLPRGARRVRVERPGFQALEVRALVKEGTPTILRLDLKR
jgi:serine/threonine-protein kinase